MLDVARRCSTLLDDWLDIARRCSTLLDVARRCSTFGSTLLDVARRCSTLLDVIWQGHRRCSKHTRFAGIFLDLVKFARECMDLPITTQYWSDLPIIATYVLICTYQCENERNV